MENPVSQSSGGGPAWPGLDARHCGTQTWEARIGQRFDYQNSTAVYLHSRVRDGSQSPFLGRTMSESRFMNGRVVVAVGDITRVEVDAVVNAANGSLMGGGGVDGAIHRAGGPAILSECKNIRSTDYPAGLPTGAAVVTGAGRLPARHVIHTVGPVYGGGGADKAEQLASCYRSCLVLALDRGLDTIAFPAISTGIYGYPLSEAAAVSSRAIRRFVEKNSTPREIRLVFFSADDARVFLKHHAFEA